MPRVMQQAVLASEDSNFFQHGGIDAHGHRPRRAGRPARRPGGGGGLDDHHAALPQPLPLPRAHLAPQGRGGVRRRRAGEELQQAADPHPLPEPGQPRPRQLRGGGGLPLLLRQAGRQADPPRGRHAGRHHPGAQPLQPLPHAGAGAPPARPRAAAHAGREVHRPRASTSGRWRSRSWSSRSSRRRASPPTSPRTCGSTWRRTTAPPASTRAASRCRRRSIRRSRSAAETGHPRRAAEDRPPARLARPDRRRSRRRTSRPSSSPPGARASRCPAAGIRGWCWSRGRRAPASRSARRTYTLGPEGIAWTNRQPAGRAAEARLGGLVPLRDPAGRRRPNGGGKTGETPAAAPPRRGRAPADAGAAAADGGRRRGDREPDRRRARHGRRLGLRPQQVQPHHPGAPAGGLVVQAVRLRRRPRGGVDPGRHPARRAHLVHRRRRQAELPARELLPQALRHRDPAAGAGAVDQRPGGQAVRAGGRQAGGRLRPPPRHPDAAPHLAQHRPGLGRPRSPWRWPRPTPRSPTRGPTSSPT